MISAALVALLSHWRRHRFQLFTLVTGLALAAALWTAVQAINSEARASYGRAEAMLVQNQHGYLASTTGSSEQLQLSDYVALRRMGWDLSPVVQGEWNIAGQQIDLVGFDFLNPPSATLAEVASPESSPSAKTGSSALVQFLQPPGRVLLHPETAKEIQRAETPFSVQLSTRVPPGTALADVSFASRVLNRQKDLSRLILLSPPGAQDLASLPNHILHRTGPPMGGEMAKLTESFHLNLTAFGFLSFAVGLFIVQGTISLALEQRRGQFRTLRCLGVSRRMLCTLLAVEITLITFIAACIGLIAGFFLAQALLPGVSVTLSGLYGAPVTAGLSLRPSWIISGFAMTFLGAFVASSQAFFTLWTLPVLQLPSTQARGQKVIRSFRAGAFLGCGLILCGFVALEILDSLTGGFVFLAGLMLGAAVFLPFFLNFSLRLGKLYSHRPLVQWLWADTAAQLPGLSLALMALLLALATNIGVSTMVSSFRLTFLGWMDQRLSAAIYITTEDDAQGRAVEAWLRQEQNQQPGLRILPIRYHETTLQGGKIRIYGLRDDPSYRNNWPMISAQDGAWDAVFQGAGLLINEQLSYRLGLGPGDQLNLPSGWPVKITGTYADYGNPHGQVLISMSQLLQNTPEVENRRFGLHLQPSEVQNLINRILEETELKRENMTDQTSVKARSLAVFDQTFRVTGALNILTLAVAGFAILTSLATLWNQRLPQLAPIWAMGVSRRTLAGLDLLRSLLIAALTACLALPLGLLLAWVLLDVINAKAFGWRLPMHLFPLDWLRLIAMALLTAGLAALISAWRLFRLQPSDLLKVFSNDR